MLAVVVVGNGKLWALLIKEIESTGNGDWKWMPFSEIENTRERTCVG